LGSPICWVIGIADTKLTGISEALDKTRKITAQGVRQSRTLGERGQSQVRGHLAELARNHLSGPVRWGAQSLYEEFYCARGDMENRIKEQMMLFADRTSTSWLRSNQIRLYFSTVAYLLMQALRGWGWRAPNWPKRNENGAIKVAQDRRPDSHHGTQNLGVAVDRLSLPGAISPGAPAVASCSSALLRGNK
jgi:Transposase DDE domain group 1